MLSLLRLSCLSFLLLSPLLAAADTPALAANALDDGPYVAFTSENRLQSLWVCDGQVERQALPSPQRKPVQIAPRCGYDRPLSIPPLPNNPATVASYSGQRIVALSDIHGQYALARDLLRSHRVIDARDRWAFGDGHLVVVGDVFDRGAGVTETLWLLFQLQQQAQAAGGAVHFLLGNHETMALSGNLRYVNPKYLQVARLLGHDYPALYGERTVLGRWLRRQPVVLRLGDTLFVHGGLSPDNLAMALAADATNAAYRASLGLPRDLTRAHPALAPLYDGKTSPIWYRGYFNGELETATVAALADRLGVARIVVGHTSMPEITSFHAGRVIGIDSNIKNGESGELLFIENGRLSRGLLNGRRAPLSSKPPVVQQTNLDASKSEAAPTSRQSALDDQLTPTRTSATPTAAATRHQPKPPPASR